MNVVILAAGMGKRMQSTLPKVLHRLAGKPLLMHVIDTAHTLHPSGLCVIFGHGGDAVPTLINKLATEHDSAQRAPIRTVLQEPQLGTGHAVMQALPFLDESVPTLILYGDVPLTRAATLQALVAAAGNDKLAILTAQVANPQGLGRIVRENGTIRRIVEQKDASPAEAAINEINSGILVAPTAPLKKWLAAISNDNAQREYYLTDIVALAVADGVPVVSAQPGSEAEILGVNSKVQLAELERIHQRALADALLEQGVTLMDPARLDVRGTLKCGRDVTIDIGCIFEGEVELADGVSVGAHCVIANSRIGAGAQVRPYCHIDEAQVGPLSMIGPYARLRPGTELGEDVHIGNFVEVKNSRIDAHSKANHLTYVGDSTVGTRVNIGAGTITCNYDGVNKSRTVIEDDAFIGSDSQLIAPVTIGKGATIAAGTTVSRDAPAGKLTISRPKQLTVESWKRPVKKS